MVQLENINPYRWAQSHGGEAVNWINNSVLVGLPAGGVGEKERRVN